MNAELLLRKFDRVADGPGAIAHLRRFVLALAVRGRLVPQDLADEPVEALIQRIQAEKDHPPNAMVGQMCWLMRRLKFHQPGAGCVSGT